LPSTLVMVGSALGRLERLADQAARDRANNVAARNAGGCAQRTAQRRPSLGIANPKRIHDL
jgi:hypothetical protein